MMTRGEIYALEVGQRIRWNADTFSRDLHIDRIAERGLDNKDRVFARVISGSLALRVMEGDPSFESIGQRGARKRKHPPA